MLTLLGGILLWSHVAVARVDIAPLAPAFNVTWAGGNVVLTQDFCVQSTQNPQPAGTDIIPYRVSVSAPFALVNGANQIAGTLQWVDLVTSTTTTLAPATPTGYVMTGRIANCPGGNNGRLILTFTEAAITGVPPAVYQQAFVVTAENTGGGRSSHAADLTVTVTIPDTVRISQLDDIDLGLFSGSTLSGSDSLCVFRASGLAYSVTLAGSGAGGAFEVTNGDTPIPLQVSWDDGVGAVPVDANVKLASRANSFSGNTHCNNGAANNAVLAVQATAADVAASNASAGNYFGVITILIELD
ncbi:MAG: hypothetical protein ACK4SX_11250 [Alcanivoracaceae bacterium]